MLSKLASNGSKRPNTSDCGSSSSSTRSQVQKKSRITLSCLKSNDAESEDENSVNDNEEEKTGMRYKPANSSSAWKFFTTIDKNHRRCNLCFKKMKFCGSTTSFITHLQKKHDQIFSAHLKKMSSETPPIENTALDPDNLTKGTQMKQNTPGCITRFVKALIPYDGDSERKKVLDEAVAIFVAVDMQPFSVVEDKGFKYLINKLDSRYQLPSQTHLTNNLIPALYKKAKGMLQKLLRQTDSISITTDAWTSVANESYLGVTCHFFDLNLILRSVTLDVLPIKTNETSDNLKVLLTDCLNDWSILGKTKHIVTDNAANMKLMAELMGKKHFPCFAHSLNLVVKESIEHSSSSEITDTIKKGKDLVSFFHKSPKASRILKKTKEEKREEGELIPGKLVQYVVTRWNTRVDMIESILRNAEGIRSVLTSTEYEDKHGLLLLTSELKILEDVKQILLPFKKATNDLSGEQYITSSMVIPAVTGVLFELWECRSKLLTSAGLTFQSEVYNIAFERLLLYEQRTVSSLATLLDARFKKKGFTSDNNYEKAVGVLQNLVKIEFDHQKTRSELDEAANSGPRDADHASDSIFAFLNTIEDNTITSTRADSIVLVNEYLKKPTIKKGTDPIQYLKQNYPELLTLGLQNLGTPGTSVPSERLFSATGQIVSDRRNRLSADNIKRLAFLHCNALVLQ